MSPAPAEPPAPVEPPATSHISWDGGEVYEVPGSPDEVQTALAAALQHGSVLTSPWTTARRCC